ncbi:HNH endonuclease family protein [Streptosporangium sp. NBC_01495]|uniref:GmrSD restriction endonuclease domain-containing protein n=1 Tax=Streptosporangium sp. NBC_01495 TaxID=2903899 RepID=UPI002E36BED3|nr:DUF1524 domain-containing protein [Streptosporangium sp. NBC_01495]
MDERGRARLASGYNSELGDMSFAEKCDFLSRSVLVVNQDIAKCERWRKARIRSRADELALRVIEL